MNQEITQQHFPIASRKPRVVISRIEGSLTVHPWQEEAVRVQLNGPVETLQQEGDTLMIGDGKSDIELWIPAIPRIKSSIFTNLTVKKVSRSCSIEGAGDVSVKDIGGNVILKNIRGSVELVHISEIAELNSIGGNLQATGVPVLRIQGGIGGSVYLVDITRAEIDNVGGNLDVQRIAAGLYCTYIGGNCVVKESGTGAINLKNIGGNLHLDTDGIVSLGNVGGNLHSNGFFSAGSYARLTVGGNAYLTLRPDTSLDIHALVGGNVSSSSRLPSRVGAYIDLRYGDGLAKLEMKVGGNLHLQEMNG